MKRDSESAGSQSRQRKLAEAHGEVIGFDGLVRQLLAIALVAGGYCSTHASRALTDKDTIVLADFSNATGDSVFDGALRQGLAVQLEQSPFLSLISDQRIQQTLRLMDQPDAKLTPGIAREICQRTASAAVIDGSIAQIGTQYNLILEVVNCLNGESLTSNEAQASDKNHVLDALGKIASEIRNKLGESLSTVRKFDTPLEQATTPSLDALKAFSSGRKVLSTTGSVTAIPFFNHAIELDPNFALAYTSWGACTEILGSPARLPTTVERRTNSATEPVRPRSISSTASFHATVTGNMEKAEQTCELWKDAYPRSEMPLTFLVGNNSPCAWTIREGSERCRQALQLNPDFPVSYDVLTYSYIALNRLDEAKSIYRQAVERKFNSASFLHIAPYQIAFLQNDEAEMTKQVAWSAGKSPAEDELLALEADTAAYSGRLGKRSGAFPPGNGFRRTSTREGSGRNVLCPVGPSGSLIRQRRRGSATPSHRQWGARTGRDVRYGVALALAYAGTTSEPKR